MIPLAEPGYEPRGKGGGAILRAVRRRIAETAGLNAGLFRPWSGLVQVGGVLYLAGWEDRAGGIRDRSWWERLDLRARLRLAADLAATAAAFEARGIRLGPVRPENLAPAGDGYCLRDPVIDDLLAPHRPEWAVFPRVCFMAPEALGGAPPSAATERFALGVTLYWLFTGRPPFFDRDPRYIAPLILAETPVDPRYYLPVLPARAAAAVLSLLAKNPAERSRPGDLRAAFAMEPVAGQEQLRWCRARRSAPLGKRPRAGARRRWPALAAGLLLAALLAAIMLPRGGKPLPTKADAESVVAQFYHARNTGDRWALGLLVGASAQLPPIPKDAAAVWYKVRHLALAPGSRPDRIQALVDCEEAFFIRGEVRRWSGREVLELAAERGRWVIQRVAREPSPPALLPGTEGGGSKQRLLSKEEE